MIFLILVVCAVVLYIREYKVPALLLFFFFLTSGFNLVPEELTNIGFFSKGSDFAFLILLGIVIIDSCYVKRYLKRDQFTVFLLGFGVFLIICILRSKWVVGLGWSDIIRTCRYQFFWIAYFVFRNMEKAQLEKLLKYLFDVTVVISVLYLLQIIFNQTILNETALTYAQIFGIKIPRYYNQPDLIQFFTLVAIYRNPYKGIWRIVTTAIVVATLLGAFHRSLQGFFLLALLIGFALKLPRLRRLQFLSILTALLIGAISVAGFQFMNTQTFLDLQNIQKGYYADVEEIDIENFQNSTFTFRLAILYERNQYLWEHPENLLLGVGLIAEDSHKASTLDFQVGLVDEITDKAAQIDCGDISYPSMIFRIGYLGTAFYLMLLIYLTVFFYKNRNHKYGFVSFLFWILSFGVSLFSSNLLLPATYLLPLIAYVIIRKTEQEEILPDTLNNQ
jgi:hypothetical protein